MRRGVDAAPGLDGTSPSEEKLATAADVRRAQIVRTSAALFDERGYGRTSMDEIARAAKLAKPTLYHYFRSKEEILHSIHDEFIELLVEKHSTRAHTSASAPASEEIKATIADILSLMETHKGHVRVYFESYREVSPAKRMEIDEKRKRYWEEVTRTLISGQRAGEFRAIDAHLVTLAISGMCNWAYHWYSTSGPSSLPEIADVFWDLLLKGLAPD